MVLVIVGLVIAGLGQLVVPSVPHGIVQLGDDFVVIPPLLVLYTAIGIGEAVVWPAQQAIFVEAGRRVGMGAVMGLNQMGGSFGFLSGSMLSAGIVALFGLEASFRYAGIATLAGALLFFLLMRRAGSAPAAPLGRIDDERRLARSGA
jgi:MFS family permease